MVNLLKKKAPDCESTIIAIFSLLLKQPKSQFSIRHLREGVVQV